MQPSPSSSILPKKWAPASSVVESRSKARELSRALERAEADLKAIDRQFQLLDSGLLSEEELRKFAGKSFFGPDDANSSPSRHRYLDAANTRDRRREQEQHRQKREHRHEQVYSSFFSLATRTATGQGELFSLATGYRLREQTHTD